MSKELPGGDVRFWTQDLGTELYAAVMANVHFNTYFFARDAFAIHERYSSLGEAATEQASRFLVLEIMS
jgi:hypothetical protein